MGMNMISKVLPATPCSPGGNANCPPPPRSLTTRLCALPSGDGTGPAPTAAAVFRRAGAGRQWQLLHRQEIWRRQLDHGSREVCRVRGHRARHGGARGADTLLYYFIFYRIRFHSKK